MVSCASSRTRSGLDSGVRGRSPRGHGLCTRPSFLAGLGAEMDGWMDRVRWPASVPPRFCRYDWTVTSGIAAHFGTRSTHGTVWHGRHEWGRPWPRSRSISSARRALKLHVVGTGAVSTLSDASMGSSVACSRTARIARIARMCEPFGFGRVGSVPHHLEPAHCGYSLHISAHIVSIASLGTCKTYLPDCGIE